MKPMIYDSMSQAASALNVPLWKLKRAKKLGCDAFANGRVDAAKLAAWLARRKAAKPTKPRPAPATPTTVPTATGTPANLRRMEATEKLLFEQMQTAAANGDPDETERLRRAWLETSEALRRADLAVEQHRRDAGELVAREQVEKALWLLHYYLNAVWMQSRCRAGVEIQQKAAIPTSELMDILDRNLRFGVLTSAAAGMIADDDKIPTWLSRAMLRFWTNNTHPQMTQRTEALAELLRESIERSTPQQSSADAPDRQSD